MRDGSLTPECDAESFARLRRAHVAWEAGLQLRVEARNLHRIEARTVACLGRRAARGQHAAAEGAQAGRAAGGGAGAAGGAGEVGEEGAVAGAAAVAAGTREWYKLLPGGLTVEVCKAWQLLPGPETHRAIEWLRARVASGALLSGQPYTYYLDVLHDEYDVYDAGSIQ